MRWGRDFTGLRRELLFVALAGAEASWVSAWVLALTWSFGHHPPLPLWLAVVGLLLGFFYLCRVLEKAELKLAVQQGVLAAALLLVIGLVLRFHVFADTGWQGIEWILEPLRQLAGRSGPVAPLLLTVASLVFLWARSLHLARRSLSLQSVGFTFRAGIVMLVWSALIVALLTDTGVVMFVAPYFFWSLLAVALARIEEVRQVRNSYPTPGSPFWISSSLVAVTITVAASSLLAFLFYGGALQRILHFLAPALDAVRFLFLGALALVVSAVAWLLSLVPIDLGGIREQLEAMAPQLQAGEPLPSLVAEEVEPSPFWGTFQAGTIVALFAGVIALVLFFTWYRTVRERNGGGGEVRESMLSADLLTRGLKDMLRAGRDRLEQMAHAVDRLGLGSRLLSALSIRRIYINLVRVATRAGYPRVKAQTPYEYLHVVSTAWPDLSADLAVITDAYIRARYGQVPDTQEELDRIVACWERVRSRHS